MSHGQVPGWRWEKDSCQSFVCMKALQQLHRTHHPLFPLHQTVRGIRACRGPEVKIVFRCNAFCQPKRDTRLTLKSIDQDGLFFPTDIVFFITFLSQIRSWLYATVYHCCHTTVKGLLEDMQMENFLCFILLFFSRQNEFSLLSYSSLLSNFCSA